MARPALSAERAVAVLNFLAAHPGEAFTLSDLVRRVHVNVASMHAVLAVLEDQELVTRADGKHYRLGPALVPLGRAALPTNAAISAASHAIGLLARELGATGLVVRANAGDLVIVDEVSPRSASAPGIGQRFPMLPPIGGVFLAWADDATVDAWVATAPRAVLAAEADLRRWLGSIRERGYAVGLETSARRGMRRAVRELADEPGSRAARGRLRDTVAELGDIATVAIELDPKAHYAVAHIAAPVVGPDGRCAMGLYLMNLHRPLTGAEAAALGTRLQHAAHAVATAAGSSADPAAARDPGGSPEPIW